MNSIDRKYIYPLTLIVIFAITVIKGDMIFLAPTPPPPSTEKNKTEISPYVKISPFDHLFREAADSLGWDWKLLAAIGHTESRFDSMAQSNAGACGVMQVMPRTLKRFGVPDSLHMHPRSNIMAATGLLKRLNYTFRRIDDFEERSNFILASYNAGIAHVNDAMRLATKHGRNRYRWHNSVDTFLILKGHPEYYNDSLCTGGKFNDWQQTLQFVKKVKQTWRHYESMQEHYNDSIYEIILSDSTVTLKWN